MGSLSVGRATWKAMPMRKQVEVMANTDIAITLPGGDVINAAFLPTKAALIVPYRFVMGSNYNHFPPSSTPRQIAALADWCLVIVGDKKGPPASKCNMGNRTVYLSPAVQEAMVEFETGHLLQWNHLAEGRIWSSSMRSTTVGANCVRHG